MELDEMLRVLSSFEREGVRYVLIGGAAVNLHGVIRATEDLDFFVEPSADNIECLKRALFSIYGDPDIAEISTEELLGDYPAVRYYPPSGELYLDILTRLGEFATYRDLAFQEVERGGVRIRVATPETLYWLKQGTVRAIDHLDAARLKDLFRFDPTGLPPGRED